MLGEKTAALLAHSIFDPLRNHRKLRLVETSDSFPRAFNPHTDLGVEYRAVSLAEGTDQANGKGMMALHAFYDGIGKGFIHSGITTAEPSSGNTGPEMQKIALELGLPFRLILKRSMPPAKLERALALCDANVRTELVSGGGAQLARELGKQPGFYNPDQYGREWNIDAQATYIAPQVFEQNSDAAAIFVLGGSCGTVLGLKRYVETYGLPTQVKMVVAAGHDDISGGKNLSQIKADILHDVFSQFPEKEILEAPRQKANLLTWLSWPHVVKRSRGLRFMFGQSFGATVFAAFNWVEARRRDGTLDDYRDKHDRVVILTLGMDNWEGYIRLLLSELKETVLEGPRTLPPLDELLAF